jgi:hypothetical protein
MNFSYLQIPTLPKELEELCLKNIDLIDNDPELNGLNKKEGVGHNITWCPPEVISWINTNIHDKLNLPRQGVTLHVSHYIKHTEGNGIHPIHFDYGRNYAINYVLDTGGSDVITSWYEDDKTTIVDQVEIEQSKWHIIKVKPTLHGVEGIKVGRMRVIISVNYSPEDMETFDENSFFDRLRNSSRFYQCKYESKKLNLIHDYIKTIDQWFPSHGFFLKKLPMEYVDDYLLPLVVELNANPLLIKIEPYNWYGFHVDENRCAAINIVLPGSNSITCFEDEIKANNSSFTPLIYKPNFPYLLNTQTKHAVFNTDKVRYAVSLGFDKPITFDQVLTSARKLGIIE